MQIKNQLGKLNFKVSISEMVRVQQQDNDIKILDIQLKHIYRLSELPRYHNDPFDRLLLTQLFFYAFSFFNSSRITFRNRASSNKDEWV